MREELNIFWYNNDRAYELFQELVTRMERGSYDDAYLTALDSYQAEAPDTPNFYIFAARYLTAHAAYDAALPLAERAYRLCPVNYEVWKLLAEIYQTLGRMLDALIMQGFAYGMYGVQPHIDRPSEMDGEHLGRLSIAAGSGKITPIAQRRAFIENGALVFHPDTFVGEFLPLTMPEGSPRYWVGCWAAEGGFLSDNGCMLTDARNKNWFLKYAHHDFTFNLQKANEITGTVTIDVPQGREVLVPIAGTEDLQELSFRTTTDENIAFLGKWAFSYFRLNEPVTLKAKDSAPYAVGSPILLGHSPQRKKLVLNILVDALSWAAVREDFPACMPHIAEFFKQGIIFNNHFSTSEFTFPALPAIETGRYPHRTHIFSEPDSHALPLDIRCLSECMKDLGYYCAAPMACGDTLCCGATRGYDRLITSSWTLPVTIAAERTLRHIEAFHETDQFLFFHITDVHPWPAKGFNFSTEAETHMPLSIRLLGAANTESSVHLQNLEIYREQFRAGLRHTDRVIGQLLSYIASRYREDEYIINLYSDHGLSIFSESPSGSVDVMGEYQTSATWMVRGAGVPNAGIVHELTSIVDIYPTLGHLCGFPVAPDIDGNLPAVFGGKERDVVYSASQFPGQTFKLAVRTHDHALRLETLEPVDKDGTVDFMITRTGIYPRGHEWEDAYECTDESLRAFFYPRAREFVRSIASNGEHWPSMREARPEWFPGA